MTKAAKAIEIWTPHVQLDLNEVKPARFNEAIAEFNAWRDSLSFSDLPPINYQLGWYTITPQDAEALLLRNKANRLVLLSTVVYYAQQMRAGEWQRTGQGVILDNQGNIVDSQHRLLACYFGGVPFDTLVVTDVPAKKNLFAYIDNGRPRGPKEALQTAKHNGLSSVLAAAIQHAFYMDHDGYTAQGKLYLPKVAPIHYIEYADEHPELLKAVRLMAGEYRSAQTVVQYSDVVAYVAYQIITRFDEWVLAQFMEEIGAELQYVESDVIKAFKALLENDQKQKVPMKKHHVLGVLIKTFNAWHRGDVVKSYKALALRVNEDFPRFVENGDVSSED